MTIQEALTICGKTEKDVKQIYRGRDHHCRCGCGGKYTTHADKGFARVLKHALTVKPLAANQRVCGSDGRVFKSVGIEVDEGHEYINIPYNAEKDLCYTIYFTE